MPPRVEVIIDPGGIHRQPPAKPSPAKTFAHGAEVYEMAELLHPTIHEGSALSEEGQLLEDTVRWLCGLPEQVHVYELRRRTTLFEVEVAPSDVPQVVGRDGQTFFTLRGLFETRSLPRTHVELVHGPLLGHTPSADARPVTPRSDAELERLVSRLVQRFVGPPEVVTVKQTSSDATTRIEIWPTARSRRVPKDVEYTCTSIHPLLLRTLYVMSLQLAGKYYAARVEGWTVHHDDLARGGLNSQLSTGACAMETERIPPSQASCGGLNAYQPVRKHAMPPFIPDTPRTQHLEKASRKIPHHPPVSLV